MLLRQQTYSGTRSQRMAIFQPGYTLLGKPRYTANLKFKLMIVSIAKGRLFCVLSEIHNKTPAKKKHFKKFFLYLFTALLGSHL